MPMRVIMTNQPQTHTICILTGQKVTGLQGWGAEAYSEMQGAAFMGLVAQGGYDSADGYISIMVAYNDELNDAQMADVCDLIDYWIANNEEARYTATIRRHLYELWPGQDNGPHKHYIYVES